MMNMIVYKVFKLRVIVELEAILFPSEINLIHINYYEK